ncbi:MAG: SUMF1/EgtB/PvdO family nonheme iron enzyme [Thermoanaerobaculia bacterium]
MDDTRKRIQELDDRLRQLESARGVMDASVLDPLILETGEELERLRAGAAEPPPGIMVEASHRSVAIGGDADRVVIITGDGNQVLASEAPPDLLFDAYLAALAGDCSKLPLGVIDTQFARAGAVPAHGEAAVRLPEVYVDLDVTAAPRREDAGERDWAWRLIRGEASGRTPLIEALTAGDSRHHVLLGDPGSGKTTFAHYLCHALAVGADSLPDAWSGLVPVRFVLREVAARHLPADAGRGAAGMLWGALATGLDEALGEAARQRLMPYLQDRLLKDGALVVLDGLDEVPEAHRRREALVEAVVELVGELPSSSRFVVTARPYAYADPRWHLADFDVLALAPFSQPQVKGFLERWYLTAARRVFSWSEATAQAKADQLRDALETRPYLGDLASRPLLLTLMATLHSSWGQLPDDRADLYEESVKLLLSRWQRTREVRSPDGELVVERSISEVLAVDESRLRGVLDQLAYTVHRRQSAEADAAADMPADISRGDLLEAFEPLQGDLSTNQLLGYLQDRAGLLINRREGIYAFPHRSFQEYLAASHLGSLPEPGEEIRRHVFENPRWWREVALLAVNRAKRGGLGNAVGILGTLQPSAPDGGEVAAEAWHAAVVCGHAVLELRLPQMLKKRPHYAAIVDRARAWLAALVEGGHLSAKDRAEAGDLLGRLGDPRPGVDAVTQDGVTLPDLGWLEVPAGSFTMGSADGDEFGKDWERPAHEVELPRFWISRHPVTNAQFRPFVDGGGYAERGYWTEAGWRWRQGAEPDLSFYSDFPEETRQAIADWFAGRPAEKRDRPFFWNDPRRAGANRPVIGVTWYEAVAFMRWLEKHYLEAGKVPGLPAESAAGAEVKLPSEAQWEKAARGSDGRLWPWQGGFEPGCCNTSETELGETCAVGIFPGGRSPSGADDMAGNVLEWTTTVWDQERFAYPYSDVDGRGEIEGNLPRVIRGGSYYYNKEDARCAARGWFDPGYFFFNLGFRCVLSLADSEF